mgnify:CR=1 FL=1|tara:strand:+ start:4593 stop:6326 length:1734 start_codon:yes stop_codon:yes gene_type:complete
MNIFNIYLENIKKLILKLNKEGLIKIPDDLSSINVDIPPQNIDSDISTNVAMVLAKINNKSPIELASFLKKIIKKNENEIDLITVVKPGFINIKFKSSFWDNFLKYIILNNDLFGVNEIGSKHNYLIEFVSANPTGPLHVGHCRGAILGDVISNLLIFNKHKVSKEYYVNDYGNQIISFTKSVYLRIRELLYKEKFPLDNPDLYPGDYLVEIAKKIISKKIIKNFENFENISNQLTKLSVDESLILIKLNLKNLGIKHDFFVRETDIVKNNEVDDVIKKLKKNNFIYEGKIKAPKDDSDNNWIERKQLLFRSTEFGDDKDRSLQKSDKSWTYFASDAAYHNNKINRNYDMLINILGADHAGYIKRITAAVHALTENKKKLICKVSQLVKLIKDGKPFKMSKRKGDYITVEDLISEVGKDATRFIMLNRSSDVELDFDFTKVKEKSKDNPLYYVQYCHARISSVFRKANISINDKFVISNKNLEFNKHESEILKKISQWPKCIEISSKKLEPHRIPVYLYELASLFHSYWNMGKDDINLRFINDKNNITESRTLLLKSISNLIKSGMKIIGVNAPDRM